MTPRLVTHMLVGLLIRSAQNEGGFATVLHKGDVISGIILVQTLEHGKETGLFERMADMQGHYKMTPIATQYWGDTQGLAQYIERRVRSDPDLWLIELDIPEPQRFIAQLFDES